MCCSKTIPGITMNAKYIIALDQGSSSSRALAIDEKGQVAARVSHAVDTRREAEGLAEFDAWELLTGQLDALYGLLSQIGPANASAVAVASQRSTVVFWDRLTGRPVAPALSWQDGRAQSQARQMDLPQETVHQLTGLYKTPYYSAAIIAWT